MCDMIELFSSLSKFYSKTTLEEVDVFFEKFYGKKSEFVKECSKTVESKTGQKNNDNCVLLKEVQAATNDSSVLSILLEIATIIRNIRLSENGYGNAYDCWDRLIEVSPRQEYLVFVYIMLGLSIHDPNVKLYRKISIATASTYFLSLTIPGSKGFHIFDEKIISRGLEVFNLIQVMQIEHISHQEIAEFWVNIANFCDDLKLMFRYVHFDEYKSERNRIIWELVKILYNNNVNGFPNNYAANLHNICYEIFDEVINAHNGDPEETLMKIMKISLSLHTHLPSPKQNFQSASSTFQHSRHISDWFVDIICKYPRILTKVLSFYIQYVTLNPEKSWRAEQHQRALDYAVKYDTHLYSQCNVSILPFLSQTLRAEDILVRQNSIDICNRLVKISCSVNWELFRHEISKVPREVYAIKEILIRLEDSNSVIKLKTLHGLNDAFLNGSEITKKILKEGIAYATFCENDVFLPVEPRISKKEIRYEKPTPQMPAYTYEGYEIIQPYFNKLPQIIFGLWNSQLGYVRKAAIALIEPMVTINPLVIYNTNFVKHCSSLSHDPISLVRKQALKMIDQLLGIYSNCFPIIWAWCNILVPMMEDNDSKNTEIASECFKKRVFDNIKGIDQSNKAEDFMPWIIIRVILTMHNRQYFQSCVNEAVKKQTINQNVLGFVESHTLTSNSTEAWVILNLVAGKIKCREPDSLVSIFIKSMKEQTVFRVYETDPDVVDEDGSLKDLKFSF